MGAENQDGTVSIWRPCIRVNNIITPAASLPPDIFQAIQTPLLNHQNPPFSRADEVVTTLPPPDESMQNRELHESPSPFQPVQPMQPIPAIPLIPGSRELDIPTIPTIPSIPLPVFPPEPQPTTTTTDYTTSVAPMRYVPTTQLPVNPWRQRPMTHPTQQPTTTIDNRIFGNTASRWTTPKSSTLNLWPPGGFANNPPSFPNLSPTGQ